MLFGAHVSSAGGIHTAIDRIVEIGGDCVQVFTQSPRMWRPTDHKPEAIERFKAMRAEADYDRAWALSLLERVLGRLVPVRRRVLERAPVVRLRVRVPHRRVHQRHPERAHLADPPQRFGQVHRERVALGHAPAVRQGERVRVRRARAVGGPRMAGDGSLACR